MLKYLKKFTRNKRMWTNIALFTAGIIILISGIVFIWISSLQIPDFQSFNDRKVAGSTKIYDRTGEILLYDIHQDVKSTNIPFESMGENIKKATIAIEDSEFYNHPGIRVTSIVRAVIANFFGAGKTQGGSTITQQLVKNTLLTQKKTYTRKIKEWVLAIKIDRAMPKDKILEYYLNEAPYGGTIYGIEEASKTYFGKKAMDLTLPEAAYLAAIPQSPTVLSPYGKNKEKLDARKNLVLARMDELGVITEEEYAKAKAEVVAFVPQAKTGIKAPHFVFFIKEYLEEKYGIDTVQRGGLKVTSTIDYALQEKGEQFVKEGAIKNEKDWNGENAGLVAIDPRTGQILSMVGSRDYFDKEIDGNFNTATALRQPGSSFKPFIYATAFNKGFTQNTVLFDLPTEFQTTCNAYGKPLGGRSASDCYMPGNYDGKFRGPMSLRNALAQSINVPAVKLFYLTIPKDSLKTAEDMGISTLGDIGQYGLTLVLGGGEVTLLDMTSAYGVFAADGVKNPYTGILKIENTGGKVLEEFQSKPKEVLPKNTALTVSDILKDNAARTPTFGANSPLNIGGYEVAVKTGTTNSNKDAWTIGYTPSIVAGVWVGNNNNTPMKKGGVSLAGPIWNKFMKEALKAMPNETFEAPDPSLDLDKKPILRGLWQGNESFVIDSISGSLATENTPPETRVEKVVTNVHTILHWVDRNDVLGPPPANPANNPQYSHWEIPIQNWWASNGGTYSYTGIGDKPTGFDNVHTGTSKPSVLIVEPSASKFYLPDQRIKIAVTNQSPVVLQKADIFINGTFLGTHPYPLDFSFVPRELDNMQSVNTIRIISYDTSFNTGETSTTFRVSN